MMKTLFLTLSQGWLEIAVAVGVVLLLRLCLRPFPKYLTCLLWLGVLFRLLCPFSLPKAANPLPAIPAPEIPLSSALTGSPQPASAAGSFDWLGLLSLLWLAGLAFFLLKGLLSLLSLKKRLKGAQKLCDNIYVSSRIRTSQSPKAHPPGAFFPQTRCLDFDSSDGRHLDPVPGFPL